MPIHKQELFNKIIQGHRINQEEALYLYNLDNPQELAFLANHRRNELTPSNIVTYVIGRILNYTNVCWVSCKFCSFYRPPGHEEGYLHSDELILEKVKDTLEKGGREILFQGGLNPKLKIDYFENLFRKIKKEYPDAILHALSPTEINYIAHISKLSLKECIKKLYEAGLHSIPGAGGEILVDRVRKIIAPYKDTTEEWLECMQSASELGIKSTASMMFGHVETIEERIHHLDNIRSLQDSHEPFRAFICWPYQPEGAELIVQKKSSALDYLKTLALSRIYLDNIKNLQVSFLTQGPKIAQLGLSYGANDLGSIMIEESVVSAEGSKHITTAEEYERLIINAGYTPKKRNTRYEILDENVPLQRDFNLV